MLIKRNVYFSAIDQESGEERLFSTTELLTEDEYLERLYSETEEKTFSSAKQKALRKAWDLQKGLASKNGEIVTNSNKIGDVMEGIRRLGRRENQIITKGKGVNASINAKAERYGSQATRVRNPETVSKEVNNRFLKDDKITRHGKPKAGKSFKQGSDQKAYDHDFTNAYGDGYDWSVGEKKNIMKSMRK